MAETEKRSDAQRYIGAALNLRNSLERNREDAEFSRLGHEIFYIFDANVFIFNASVEESGTLNNDLDDLVGRGEGRAEISRAIARLTADFLFSGKLPGQKEPKGYITLSHFEESLDKASEIGRLLEIRAARSSPLSEERTRKDIDAILKSKDSMEEKLRQLGEFLPKAWLSALDARAHFRRALRECFIDPGTIVPLDRTPRGAAAGRLERDDLQPWFNVLPDPSRRRTIEAIRGDARTLATIVNLYRADTDAKQPDPRRLYVLVTSDGTLASAVRERRLLLAEEGIPNFIRSPRDYLPLLNLESMSNAMDRVKPTPKMRSGFNRVFETLSSAIDWIAVMSNNQNAVETLEQAGGPLRDLQHSWLAIAEYVAILNARSLLGEDSIFSDLRNFITGEAERTVTQMVETSVRAVRDRHLAIALDATLSDLKRAGTSLGNVGPRRTHLKVIGDIFGTLAVPGGDINSYLDAAIGEGKPPAEVTSAMVSDPGRPEAQLFAACLFIAADRWSPAVKAATRAVEKLETSRGGSLFDARYLLALSLRFSMRNRRDFDRATGLLNQNLAAYADRKRSTGLDWLRRLRDEMELGSLFISGAVMQELSLTPTGERHLGFKGVNLLSSTASSVLKLGIKSLRNAFADLTDNVAPSEPSGQRIRQFMHGLRLLATTNLTEAYIFEQIAPGLQGSAPNSASDLEEMLSALKDEIDSREAARESLRYTQYIYYWRGRALSARTSDERSNALQKLDEVLKVALSRHDLPMIDLLEFDYIKDKLSEEQML